MILAEEIKRATNIREVVGRYVELRKRGREWVGLCPFHADSSPSLYVNEEKMVFLCRGCGVGGDVFTFVERIEGITFPAAVQKLAGAAGLADAMAPHVSPLHSSSLQARSCEHSTIGFGSSATAYRPGARRSGNASRRRRFLLMRCGTMRRSRQSRRRRSKRL